MHLGYEYTNYSKVCEFFELARQEADQVVLIGDTFDLWRYPVANISTTTMPGFLAALEQMKLTGAQIPVIVIPGNHDYNLKNVWKDVEDYNVQVKDEYTLPNGMYCTHGWQFDVLQRAFSWAYDWLVTRFPYLYQVFFRKPSRMGLPKADKPNAKINRVHGEAASHAFEHEHRAVIMGHTHHPGVFMDGMVIDCGDFVDSCSFAIVDGNKITIKSMLNFGKWLR